MCSRLLFNTLFFMIDISDFQGFYFVLIFWSLGRPPYVEVRKISSGESSETIEREPFIFDSSDTEDELDDEETTEPIENGTFYADNTYKISPNTREESGEGTISVRLFVYGVGN